MTANATLADNVRQIVILVVGARFDAAYEIYAHIAVAEQEGMHSDRLATLVANLKPTDLPPMKVSPSTLHISSCAAGRCPNHCTDSQLMPSASMAPMR